MTKKFSTSNTNYYELLNLETNETHRPNNKKQQQLTVVKKAYRKQAQLYHPDKASRNNMTVEEATSQEEEEERLFQKEAEQMREREQRRQKQTQYSNDWGYDSSSSSFYDKMRDKASNLQAWKESLNSIDPWRVFEDFFFQEPSTGGDSSAYHDSSSTTNQYHQEAQQKNPPNNGYRNSQAPHVSETTVHRGYDPYMDADVYTVIGQDFVQGVEVDPYTGFVLREYYSAITGPYLVEEDRPTTTLRGDDCIMTNYTGNKTEATPKTPRLSASRLEQGESISLNDSSDPWLSPNGMFEAFLSPTCELQIIRRDNEADQDTGDDIDPDDRIVWSSETYIPDTRAHGCHLTLNSLGRLILSIDYGSGLGQVGNSVLWNSPTPPVVPYWVQGDQQQSVTFYYYASLDDDGVIAVYRQHTPKRPKVIDTLGAVYGRISKTSTECGQTKAALAYDQLRHNMGSLFMGRPRSAGATSSFSGPDSLSASTNSEKLHTPNAQLHHECVYSTSPTGCFSPGRNAIHLTKKLARSIKRSVKTMDSHLDNLISMLTQPADEYEYDTYDAYDGYGFSTYQEDDDDEDDMLDTIIRVTGAAGKIGLEAAQAGMKQGRKVAGQVVGKMKTEIPQVVGRMKERIDDYGNS
ncbi:hypothetical protein QTG54_002928 [Skeletonema marinoi]|uniref:J domain-containing protein n=1 Tax=Skeletonema marinoi TaxID=267567 RepID=A0AAD9DG00_9STRA|nr:hypothetical protein QTG54_002928 [Skeletonema marinoi]